MQLEWNDFSTDCVFVTSHIASKRKPLDTPRGRSISGVYLVITSEIYKNNSTYGQTKLIQFYDQFTG